MDPRVVHRLRCPVCAEPLAEAAAGTTRALRCPRRHSFDVARQGYVNLLAGRAPHVGDTAEMVAARADFLAAGHYDLVSAALADAATDAVRRLTAAGSAGGRSPGVTTPAEPTSPLRPLCSAPTDAAVTKGDRCGCGCRAKGPERGMPTGAPTAGAPTTGAPTAGAPTTGGPTTSRPTTGGESGDGTGADRPVGAYPLVVDAGAGTGRHLAAVLAALPDAVGLALDVSKPALRRAARAHPRAAAALADTWQRLPLADASTAVLLNVFAPRNGAEFRRVLHPAGALLVVTPAEDHLTELVDALGLLRVDPAKADRVAGSLGEHFDPVATTVLRSRLELTRPEVATLVGMGPSAWHAGPAVLAARIAALTEPVGVTLAVRLGTHRPR
ncbi:putative RNA methyltransferase [Micromonospora sp. B11E3]|uniref:putative RNA methyltransferase n=1 Tax=Micromonospora sp. B11E3 TaxID=3153562 RepID=UPI00325EB8B0